MKEIDFYKLPRPVQDALLDAFRGQFTPAPLLMRPATRPTMAAWAGLSLVAALALASLCAVGFGKVDSRLGLQSTPILAIDMLLAATCVLGVIQTLACRSSLRALPFKPGIFLFPANLIDARDHRLRVFPLAELKNVSAGGRGTVTVQFEGGAFSFQLADPAQAPAAVQHVEAARDRMRAQPDPTERRQLDPLEPPKVASPLASSVAMARVLPLWQRIAWPIAALLGVMVGGAVFFTRNAMSDNRMFETARALNDVASYKAYVAQGRRHLDEVAQTLLPRAELRLAVAEGTVEAIDAFVQAYPKTAIQAEIDLARRNALNAELGRARDAGTLAALLSFDERYPGHGLDAQLGEAKHALYERARDAFESQLPKKGSERQAAFVKRLLVYAEKIGPKVGDKGPVGPSVQIRFRRLPSKDLERAEELVTRNPMYGGVTSLPSRYVTPERFVPHEKATAKALAEGLAKGFAPEIVTFEAGPPVEGEDDKPISVTTPTLVVSYRVEASGAAHARKKPRGIYLGLMFVFKAEFLLPGDDAPLTVKHRLVQRIPMDILNAEKGYPAPGAMEAAVYEKMTSEAFAELTMRYLAKWFTKPPPAQGQ